MMSKKGVQMICKQEKPDLNKQQLDIEILLNLIKSCIFFFAKFVANVCSNYLGTKHDRHKLILPADKGDWPMRSNLA